MKKLSKIFNYVFRLSVIVSLGAVLREIASGSGMLKMFNNVTEENVMEALNSFNGDFTAIADMAKTATGLLLLCFVLSILAFKSAGAVVSVLRSLGIGVMTMVSAGGMTLLTVAELISKNMNGLATAEQVESMQSVIDMISAQGASQNMVLASAGIAGIALAAVVAAGLAILVITSVISVIKTVKAETL